MSHPHPINSPQSKLASVQFCQGCDLPIEINTVGQGKSAYCPRCGAQLCRGGSPSLSGNLAIAITCLLLFIPAFFFDFISIRLLGVVISATLLNGVWALIQEGFGILALLIFFCSSLAPLLLSLSVIVAHISLHKQVFRPLKYSLTIIQHLKAWMMLDVFLISVAIACFKLQDYADIMIGPGLIGLILLQIAAVLLVTRLSVRHYWEEYMPEPKFPLESITLQCHTCHLSQPESTRCIRCHSPVHHREPNSIEKTWAYLFTASVAIFPANLLPISILITNGRRLEDTIMSGVAGLFKNGMSGIAIIIFIASIVVPVAKILILSYILLMIKFKRRIYHKQRMLLYFAVKWIGRWSMMDLFVISIMMTLLDRGQLLDFTPGYGAVAFGVVVVFAMLAAESLDSRLIWDNHQPSSIS